MEATLVTRIPSFCVGGRHLISTWGLDRCREVRDSLHEVTRFVGGEQFHPRRRLSFHEQVPPDLQVDQRPQQGCERIPSSIPMAGDSLNGLPRSQAGGNEVTTVQGSDAGTDELGSSHPCSQREPEGVLFPSGDLCRKIAPTYLAEDPLVLSVPMADGHSHSIRCADRGHVQEG